MKAIHFRRAATTPVEAARVLVATLAGAELATPAGAGVAALAGAGAVDHFVEVSLPTFQVSRRTRPRLS
ncbi:MAG: hypothetical protein V2J16_05020 [Thermoleophilia bacterium]|nr:hypothetical protein [Thermoleophilia bacterium]